MVNNSDVVLAMTVLCRTRFLHLLAYLVSADLAGGIEEGGESSSCNFLGMVDLVSSKCVASLVSEDSDRFKGSTAMTLVLGDVP